MRKVLGMVVAAVFFVGAVAIASGPKTVTIDQCKKRKAAVTFNHEAHVKNANGKCNTCHHKWDGKGEPHSCFKCHGCKKKGNAPKAMKAFHKNCKGCHKKMGKGPTKCKECHK